MFYLGMFCSFWDFSGFVSFDFARPSLCQVFFQVFHVLPDYLQMLLDCNVKAPSTQVSEIFRTKDLSSTIQTLDNA